MELLQFIAVHKIIKANGLCWTLLVYVIQFVIMEIASSTHISILKL